jgi:hypothetical protein
MFLFKNTHGGIYKCNEYGQTITYTFPLGASINLNGIELNISGLTVESYGGRFDDTSVKYFAKAISKIPSASTHIINTSLFMVDRDISGDGYPDREEFNRYKVPYLSPQDFNKIQYVINELPRNHPDLMKHQNTVRFIIKWREDSKNNMKHQLNAIFNQNNVFPKYISILYDDRELEHTTHIILEYTSKNECILKIDNTISIAERFGKALIEQVKTQYNLDITIANESFSNIKPNFIKFHNKDNPTNSIELELNLPIQQKLIDEVYTRMISALKGLQVPIRGVLINSSPYNQKLTSECVPFSIQNKINFIEQEKYDGEESVLEKAARVRAEQAVLVYLFNGATNIPKNDEQTCKDLGISYQQEQWYPNYAKMCEHLNTIISQAPVAELEELYLAIELDDCLSLSDSFKPFLLKCIKSKVDMSHYVSVAEGLSKEKGQFLQEQYAPSMFFKKSNQTLFASVEYLSQIDKESLDELLHEEFNPK